eukprot:CAMPEP_0178449982 /NCGR_PEP_ID=MMETSP0689_2-20121128/42861_1 /TAXON_ID=160604 /ORGANISM="Amphidinium massartii, Strain CS-259" /LENGTH=189 /DNA_ID=CAMNT_0020075377 /DNA_START=591 /DNA_END=1162 /DNA_ORIENTATION=-
MADRLILHEIMDVDGANATLIVPPYFLAMCLSSCCLVASGGGMGASMPALFASSALTFPFPPLRRNPKASSLLQAASTSGRTSEADPGWLDSPQKWLNMSASVARRFFTMAWWTAAQSAQMIVPKEAKPTQDSSSHNLHIRRNQASAESPCPRSHLRHCLMIDAQELGLLSFLEANWEQVLQPRGQYGD